MALTAYQQQFKRRMKRAIGQRAKADQKARRYIQLLSDAIGAADDGAAQLNELNKLYNVDVSTYTLLMQVLYENSGQKMLQEYLAKGSTGDKAINFNQVPDGNGGQPLPANTLFGEVVVGTPSSPATQPMPTRAEEEAQKKSYVPHAEKAF